MLVPTTLTPVDARRFLRAWRSFRCSEAADGDDRLRQAPAAVVSTRSPGCQQFYAVALALGRAADSAEDEHQEKWREVRAALRPALEEISGLAHGGGGDDDDAHFRLPRAAELLVLRKQREKAQLKQKTDAQAPRSARSSVAEAPGTPRREPSPRRSADGAQLAKELSAADFRSMLEPRPQAAQTLSTQDIRRRLGSAANARVPQATTAAEAAAREEQEAIQSDMMSLAKELKQRTQTINQSLLEDVKILDAVGQSAEANVALLDREYAALKQYEASAIGFKTSMALILALVLVFVAAYLYMKLFSRRRW